MADINKSLADVKERMRKFQKEQEDQLLNLRNNYQETINAVMSEAQQGAVAHREILERKYLAAYEDIEKQLRMKFEGTLKQVESELEALKNETNNRIEEAKHQIDENTNRVEMFKQGQKEMLEREISESQKKMQDAELDYEQLSRNCFAKVLYGALLYEYQKMCRSIQFYFGKEFYQTVVALSLSLSLECNVKNNEIKIYMDKYARRLLALKSEVEKYQALMVDNYKNADLYGYALCEACKINILQIDEKFIDYWSNGMYSLRMSRLEQGIAFLKEHGIELGEKYDANTVLERIKVSLAGGLEEKKEKLIEYINTGDIIVYDMEKTMRDEIAALKSEEGGYGKSLKLYNDRLNIEKLIDAKLQQYQYCRIEDEKNSADGGVDCRIGVSLKYENEEGCRLEICIISVKNNLNKCVENQIAIVVDYDELGIIAEQYIRDRKAILREIPLLKNYVIETCGGIHTSVDTKYADMQRVLYDKCNPCGRL